VNIPEPKFKVGDRVVPRGRKDSEPGVIEKRSYNNLEYVTQWKYQIRWGWGDEHVTNWHYCHDLELAPRGT